MDTVESYVLALKNVTYNSTLYISPRFAYNPQRKASYVEFATFEEEMYIFAGEHGFRNKDDAIWAINRCKKEILDFISNYNSSHSDQLSNDIILEKFTYTSEKEELDTFKLED